MEDTYGVQRVKLPAGHMVLYPATSLHHVTPVTRGARICSFFWIQSMMRDDGQRRLLFDLDLAIQRLGRDLPDQPAAAADRGATHRRLSQPPAPMGGNVSRRVRPIRRMKLRKIIFWLHLVGGLIAGAVVLVMSVTGVLLAFERQMIEWADRDLRVDSAGAWRGAVIRQTRSSPAFARLNRRRAFRLDAAFRSRGSRRDQSRTRTHASS